MESAGHSNRKHSWAGLDGPQGFWQPDGNWKIVGRSQAGLKSVPVSGQYF